MLIDRVFTPGLAQVAYLVADQAAGEVAVIDPRRDVQAYLDWAATHQVRITAILETHVHADFVSGSRELAMRTGAPIYASRLGAQAFPHHPLDDGDEVLVGDLRLRALWTPGHTPEHLSYLLFNGSDAAEPTALFSGDSLFVGDVGRPDLLGEEQTEELSNHLYETVSQRFAPLPDNLTVYPGHTAGSACGKKIGDAPQTTIGAERMSNYAFRATNRAAFVEQVLEDMPTPPAYYPVLKRVNARGATLMEELAPPVSLSAPDVAERRAAGALLVDTRTVQAFGESHVPGSLFAGFGPNFAAWMGWVAPHDRDVILVLPEDVSLDVVVTALRQIGIDRVIGYLDGGIRAWRDAGFETATLPQITVRELAEAVRNESDTLAVLDVRSDDEWASGHIPGAAHTFAGDIAQGASAPDALDRAAPIAVICGSGYRSSIASSLLRQQGYTNLINVVGGMDAWNEAKLPVTKNA